MWIRRIHLYSGLFMLPWVLLYGATALLFNHPTLMSGSQTEIDHFNLDAVETSALPNASTLASLAVASALQSAENGESIELINPENAIFTRRAFGSVTTKNGSTSVILDLNSGKGYVRKRMEGDSDDEAADGDDYLAFAQRGAGDDGVDRM